MNFLLNFLSVYTFSTANKGLNGSSSLPLLSPTSRPNTSGGQRGASISSDSKAKNDITFRLQARNEAYRLLRENSNKNISLLGSFDEEEAKEQQPSLPILKQRSITNLNASSTMTDHTAYPAHLTRASFLFSS